MGKEPEEREDSKTEEALLEPSDENSTFDQYYKLTDMVMKAALDELKIRSIDRRNMQDAKLRQLIYLCISLTAAVSAVITLTPYWAGKDAALGGASPWHLALLCVSFLLGASGFIYGAWALMGENGGTVPIVDEYAQILRDGYGPDEGGKPYEATIAWLQKTDRALEEYRGLISAKARKIRTLNKIVLCAAGCATVAVVALFSTTLLENYVREEASAICAQASASESPDKEGTFDDN